MKIKLWLKYLIYLILICFLIVLREYVGKLFAAYFKQEFRINYCYLVINLLIGVGIGLFLGLEHFINEIRKEGTWKVNIPKLVLVALPSLYFALTNIWIYSGNQFLQNVIAYPLLNFLGYGTGYVTLFQVILGYMVITSFYKYSEKVCLVQPIIWT